jgi:hypothetical protein
MDAKFDYYDAVAHLIPGTFACLLLAYDLDLLGIEIPRVPVGSLGSAAIGIAIAYTVGHLLQSVASSLEPLYYRLWGGRPSIRLLESRSRHFSDRQRSDLITQLLSYFGTREKCPEDVKGARDFHQRLFERCMTLCNRNSLGRVERFNAIYGFHRVLLTTFLLAFAACLTIWILQRFTILAIPATKLPFLSLLVVFTAIGVGLEIFRARKRCYHYAREVLWMTSDFISSQQPTRHSGSKVGDD